MDSVRLIAVYDALNEKIERLSKDQKQIEVSMKAPDMNGLEKAIKAQGKLLADTLKAMSDLSDAKLETLLSSKQKPDDSIPKLIEAFKVREAPIQQNPVRFRVKRDDRGLIETVIATPVDYPDRITDLDMI